VSRYAVVCCAAKSLCFTKEEHWRLFLSGVLEDVVLRSADEQSIPSTLYKGWWRHPAQLDIEFRGSEKLAELLSCSPDTSRAILSRCSDYRDRG
jgi:hypothetical protein